MQDQPKLKRTLTLPLLTLYGLGTTIGAGIFVLVGKAAGRAGLYAPAAFLVAVALVAFTAFSFGELAARHPRSAGEAIYVREGLRSPRLALLVGLLVALAGIVSAATIANGAVGYVQSFLFLPGWTVVLTIVFGLSALAAWGITESALAVALTTLLEAGALLVIAGAGLVAAPEMTARLPELVPPFEGAAWGGIFAAAILAFYAFIGFEDMVNVAEEVKDVSRTMPAAITLTLLFTGIIYMLVSTVVVLAVPIDELAASDAPLAFVFERTTGLSPLPISAVAIFATLNGALVQIVMASRVLYGLSAQDALPRFLGRIHPRTHTPLAATALAAAAVLAFAYWLPLETLAEITSLATLVVFSLCNIALWRLKRASPRPPGVPLVPIFVPITGAIVSSAFLFLTLARMIGL